MVDMSKFVIPKSDQLNADDLIVGPRTITITHVSGTSSAEQPVAVYFNGDDGKPYKPCKSMRRVMIAAWGVDAAQYVGRSMTIYRDPEVMYGGIKVGGVRISAMSHIDQPLGMALTVTKAKRAPYRVAVLKSPVERAATKSQAPAANTTPMNGDTESANSGHPAAADHVGSEFGLPPMGDDGVTPLDLDAIKKRYEGYCAAKDRAGLKGWIGALTAEAQAYVRRLMADDKAGTSVGTED